MDKDKTCGFEYDTKITERQFEYILPDGRFPNGQPSIQYPIWGRTLTQWEIIRSINGHFRSNLFLVHTKGFITKAQTSIINHWEDADAGLC
ncbi:hypothetical protein [Desulfosporosinus sp. FKA]|uniref:hypothetical protein n=1 Tax=Desulfosporosinus sp. FKA TaxID=1969834 RepID=UPI000B49CDF9|nr:hypothetical protein [Desulfosporosinus sp. FKA]